MTIISRVAALIILASPAMGQGLVTPQDFTRAGAGGPVTGITPPSVAPITLPPANGGGAIFPTQAPRMPTIPTRGYYSQPVPVIEPHGKKARTSKRLSAPAKDYLYDIGKTPSIMVEPTPPRKKRR